MVVTIANAGHYSMQETPQLYAATAETFLSEQAGQ